MKITFRVESTDPNLWTFASECAGVHIQHYADRPAGFAGVVGYRVDSFVCSVWWTKGRALSVHAYREEVKP